MSKTNLILVGGGGDCKSVIEALAGDEKVNIIGILDYKNSHTSVLDIPIIGDDAIIPDLVNQQYHFLITLGNIGSPAGRVRLYEQITSLKGIMATVVSPNAIVSPSATLGEGTIIMQKALVNTEAMIGNNCIINTGAVIEHETYIGNNVHVATSATVNGQCRIGNNCFIGSGSIISNNITIEDNIIIGAGSIVVNDLLKEGTYFGNPARLKPSDNPNRQGNV